MADGNWPVAQPRDVSSIEELMRAFDECLTFAPGRFVPNSNRLRSLFLPTAAVVSPLPWKLQTDAEGFIDFFDKTIVEQGLDKTGLAERNSIRRIVTIGGVNSVYAYYTLHSPPDSAESFGRGVNLFHIVWMNDRYAIASLMWEDESPSAPTPADLLRPTS